MRFRLEYALAWCVVRAIGILPRPLARAVGIGLGQLIYLFHGKLRRVGMRNLELAFPAMSVRERRKLLWENQIGGGTAQARKLISRTLRAASP